MKLRYLAILLGCSLVACSDEEVSSPETAANVDPGQDRIERLRSKADDVRQGLVEPQEASEDACEYYQLYDDGYCDTECPNTDPDCEAGRPISDSLEWLCELETDAENGICIPICGRFGMDLDCTEDDLTPPERTCAEDYDNLDGECDSECFPEDDDCLALADTCLDELRYGDSVCDEDCAFEDPDCNPDLLETADLTESELALCSRLPEGEVRRDLAASYCGGRAAADRPVCIAVCASTYD